MTPLPTRLPEADTARVPMVEVPVQLLERCLGATRHCFAYEYGKDGGNPDRWQQLEADLKDALAAH